MSPNDSTALYKGWKTETRTHHTETARRRDRRWAGRGEGERKRERETEKQEGRLTEVAGPEGLLNAVCPAEEDRG